MHSSWPYTWIRFNDFPYVLCELRMRLPLPYILFTLSSPARPLASSSHVAWLCCDDFLVFNLVLVSTKSFVLELSWPEPGREMR